MSKADTLFVNMCREILDNGFSSEGQIQPGRGIPCPDAETDSNQIRS